MQEYDMKVLIVDREDYDIHLRSIWGLKITQKELARIDLVIDRETGKILKSRQF